jgi:ATP-dependent DNA ligase
MNNVPLFHKDRVWKIETVGNKIITTYGVVGGKMIVQEKKIEGKNGKSEKTKTTGEQQAMIEAKREYDAKIKQGYHVEGASMEKIIKPMLAIEMDKKNIKFPVMIQPKLDGIRCLIYKNDGIVFQSRQNKLFEPFQHLLPELETLFDSCGSIILDGELYCHGLGFEKITSMVRRGKTRHPEVDKLQYIIYDVIGPGTYTERMKPILAFQNEKKNEKNKSTSNICLIETIVANSMKEVEDAHTKYTAEGYEGIMLRQNGLYKEGRSKDLLKYKKFMDKEYEVIGHVEGTGTHAGTPIFVCKTNDKTFHVTLNGPMETRRDMMKHVTDYYGKQLTVKYQELSVDGIPRFPIGLGFRDYE